MKYIQILILTPVLTFSILSGSAATKPSRSFFTQKPDDPAAVYFTPQNFDITNDGRSDVSIQLQNAINKLKTDRNFGILFIPEGNYTISKTIYIPASIRLIGYGKSRPLIILKKNSPGFQTENPDDKGKASYMFWFTSNIVENGKEVRDASAGTFYSALSNIGLVDLVLS